MLKIAVCDDSRTDVEMLESAFDKLSAYGERCAYLGEIKFDVGRSCGLFWNWYQ